MGISVGGVSPQVKLRLRKRNKNITLESIDKYNKNKLLKVFSDCYIDMQVLEVYPGEIDDRGEPTSANQYTEWKNSHPDDIPDNLRNVVYNLVTNNIYPKLHCLQSEGHLDFPVTSLLSNFYATKFNHIDVGLLKVVGLVYISKNVITFSSPLQRIEINLSPFPNSGVKIYNIQSNIVKI